MTLMERSRFAAAYMRAKHELREFLSHHPSVFLPLSMLDPRMRSRVVRRNTDLVMDGYPRSGNSFALMAFNHAQETALRVGHHLHASSQILGAVKYCIPTLVIVRDPLDAVVSLVVREPWLSPAQGLRNYIAFHRRIYPVRQSYVVGLFADVTSDFGSVTRRLNMRFGTNFGLFENTQDNVNRCFAQIEWVDRHYHDPSKVSETKVSRPSPQRIEIKREVRSRIMADTRLKSLIGRSIEAYELFTSIRD